MYLGCALLDSQFPLVPRKERPEAGPDLCIRSEVRRIWIEAIAPQQGTGPDRVPAVGEADGWVPESRIVLRYCAAVKEKSCKREGYIEKNLTATTEPFVVAINGFQIRPLLNASADEVPYAVQSVLPLGVPTATVDVQSGGIVGEGFETRWNISKRSGTQIGTGTFLDQTYSTVSGILFSDVHPLYVRDIRRESLAFLHNPNAGAPMQRGWLRTGTEYWVEGNALFRRVLGGA